MTRINDATFVVLFVQYSPTEGVPAMRRAKAGGHKGAVKQIMGSHVDIEVWQWFG